MSNNEVHETKKTFRERLRFSFRRNSSSSASRPLSEGSLSEKLDTNQDGNDGFTEISARHSEILGHGVMNPLDWEWLPQRLQDRINIKETYLSSAVAAADVKTVSGSLAGSDADMPDHSITSTSAPATSSVSTTSASSATSDDPSRSPLSVTVRTEPRQKRGGRKQPKGTLRYEVTRTDTMESIAAQYDITPSELKKCNRLMNNMVFPGQILFVPDRDYQPSSPSSPVSPITNLTGDAESQPTFSQMVPKNTAAPNKGVTLPLSPTEKKAPGIAERVFSSISSVTSSNKDSENSISGSNVDTRPRTLSNEEARLLDQECLERFIKIKVKHITDGEGVVSGVLLVTPNAVMFDPYVSDPLVIEHGAEMYGMMAPMDVIISVAMYHDIAAMRLKNAAPTENEQQREVYHGQTHRLSCPFHKENEIESTSPPVTEITADKSSHQTALPISVPTKYQELAGSCTCNSPPHTATPPNFLTTHGLLLSASKRSSSLDTDDVFRLSPDNLSATSSSKMAKQIVDDPGSRDGQKTLEISAEAQNLSQRLVDMDPKKSINTDLTQNNVPNTNTESSDFNQLDPENVNVDTSNHQTSVLSDCEAVHITVTKETPKKLDNKINTASSTGEGQSMQSEKLENSISIEKGTTNTNISSLDGGTVNLKNTDICKNRVVDELQTKPRSHSSPVSIPISTGDKNKCDMLSPANQGAVTSGGAHKLSRTLNSIASLGSFSASPNFNNIVDFSSGLFTRGTDERGKVKDMKDVAMVTPSPSLLPQNRILSMGSAQSEPKADETANSTKKGAVQHIGDLDIQVESAVKLDDKPELFRSLDSLDFHLKRIYKLIPRPAAQYEDPPLYLCIRVGTPINKSVSTAAPIESYLKKQKKPEYWFSIPRDRVDHLYAFFIQWSPSLYGSEDEIDPAERGFIVIDPASSNDDPDLLELAESMDIVEDYFEPNQRKFSRSLSRRVSKGWEVVNINEAKRRLSLSLAEEHNLPLPDMSQPSTIIEDKHLRQLASVLPARAVGYEWNLVYCTDKHGFSLRNVYRHMQGVDSPVYIIIKDTRDQIFGALISCALKMSDHFYGTGESFLFTFYPEFRKYQWTGNNNFFVKGNAESIYFGAGEGSFGIYLDGDLCNGRTKECRTFDNAILCETEDFIIKNLEAWSFI